MSTELRRARSRQMVIFLLVCGGMLLLLGKLYYWQAILGPTLAGWANDEHVQNQTVYAPRGRIYDAQGLLLATNIVRDDVYVEPQQLVLDYPDTFASEREKLVQQLHAVLPNVVEEKVRKALSSETPTYRIAVSIDPEQSKKLRALRLHYTFLEPRTWRNYPAGDLAAQILGYVGNSQGDGPPQGVYGLEKKYNTSLSGKAGSFSAETDLNGNPLTVGASTTQDKVDGADLTLTIDGIIQYQVQTQLEDLIKKSGARSGTVVVLNARTGAIVALAGAPTFDPNSYGNYANDKGCLGQLEVYSNPALYCAYEPGSTMKSITMAAGIDQHVITPDTTIQDPGYHNFADGTPTVTNWDYPVGHGTETMTEVLEHSANVGASMVAHDYLGPNRFYTYLDRFGFGQCTGLFEPEACGNYSKPGDKGWTPSDLARQSFGQTILVTPLQVAMAYQALANNGVLMRPYVVSAINDDGHRTSIQPKTQRQVITADSARTLTTMLVANAEVNKEVSVPGYSVAMKTGTGTTQGISADQTEASMAGYLPASNPQFVILTKVDRPRSNIFGAVTSHLWGSIAQQLMWRYNVPPDLSFGKE
ncbi:MAG: penicillin-binding protein 2 [Ktedonobacteraceae bacterium]|nr:penicillin-binding protein 2 [Ktedonobacteraceae bacterium]